MVDFDDLFGGASLDPEPQGDRAPPLGLIVMAPARKKENGFDELAAECALYLAQIRRHPFVPIFEEDDELDP